MGIKVIFKFFCLFLVVINEAIFYLNVKVIHLSLKETESYHLCFHYDNIEWICKWIARGIIVFKVWIFSFFFFTIEICVFFFIFISKINETNAFVYEYFYILMLNIDTKLTNTTNYKLGWFLLKLYMNRITFCFLWYTAKKFSFSKLSRFLNKIIIILLVLLFLHELANSSLLRVLWD